MNAHIVHQLMGLLLFTGGIITLVWLTMKANNPNDDDNHLGI